MANTKEYKIVINGLTESINAVDSLNKQLDTLEKRINAINTTKVSTPSGGGGGSNASALSAEEAAQREINKLKAEGEKLDAKIVATQDEIYKRVDATKQLYKETVADQKALAAQERLTADAYSNTMQGMKAQLADIKAVINSTDLGDSTKIEEMTKKANELTSKLKEMEAAYGTYSRDVGNYANGVAEGLQKIKITVGDTVREFGSAREASRTLNNELKSMALNGQQDTEAFKQLRQVVMELESNINDAKKPMDSLMDSMEGVMAVANAGQGIRALFGVDDTEIQKSIKNLVALQNVLKGLETINRQIQTREGVGKWIAPFTTQIDAATAKLLKFNTALLGTSKAAKVAAVGIKAFGTALKVAISMGILVAVDLLVEKLMDLVESFKKVDDAAENAKKVQEEGAKAYAEAAAKIALYKQRVESFNGTKKQEKKLVEEFNKDLGEGLGTYKSISEVQKALIEKSDAYCEALKKEAEAQALLNLYTEAFVNLQRVRMANAAGENDSWWRTKEGDMQHRLELENEALKKSNNAWNAYLAKQKEIEKHNKDNKLFDYSDQIEKDGKKSKKAVENVEAELAKARIAAMKEGLNKTILQLEEERKARLAKLDRNAKDYKQQEAQWNQFYNDRILEETEKWSRKMNKVYSDLYSAIASYATNNLKMVATETKEEFDRALKSADDKLSDFSKKMAGYSSFGGKTGYGSFGGKTGDITQYALKVVSLDNSPEVEQVKQFIDLEREAITAMARWRNAYYEFEQEKNKLSAEEVENGEKRIKFLEDYYKQMVDMATNANEQIGKDFKEKGISYKQFEDIENALYNEGYAYEISRVFKERIAIQKVYWDDVERITKEGAEREKKARLDVMYKEQQEEDAANLAWRDKTLQDTLNYYKELREGYDTQLKNGLMPKDEYVTKTAEAIKRQQEDIQSIYEEYGKRMNNIQAKYETERLNIIKESTDKVKKVTVDELNQRMTEMRDFQTQISNLEQKQPVMTVWGTTNWKETKKNNQQIKDSYIELALELAEVRTKAIEVLGDKNASKEFKDQAESVLREARNMTAGIGDTLEELKYKMSNWAKTQTLFQDLQQYFQELVGSFQTIMQAVWQYQENAFDDEQDELDKLNEELDKKLDEQQEIVEKHKDAIDSIEDELATSRGDRRQHLIDQLNAEMAAQREAQKQEQKIQKEKEAAQKKQDELEKKRKRAQYKRDQMQAIVNGAMAVTYAAMNTWPIPAIPMMALAAATTAAQLAIMASNKPYAKGGLLEGKSHAQGGIPIPGTGIEVEGKEYVIRKKSTAPNIEVLDYINKSERKLTLDDFIDFYASGKAKRTISSISPSRRFADGGTIPSLSTDIDISDRLLTTMEAYANRPVVVSVVDINNRQAAVRNVQVLAGLENS